jgi:zinc transport system substrate-binding protein
MEDIDIITSSYPLEYILTTLYGDHSEISSIFPDGVDTYTYKLNDKALENYSHKDLFVYVSYGRDKDIAVNLLNRNKGLLIIDGSLGMKPDYIDELWLNPSNMLMVALNVKNGLTEYIDNNYLIKDIEKNYDTLKLELSMLDAEIKLTAENATYKTIVTANKSLNFLKKYGFNVISLDDDNTALDKTVQEVNSLIKNNTVKYIYTLENTEVNETVKNLLDSKTITEIKIKRLDSITDNERRNNDTTYFTLMKHNIEQLKKEAYK